MSDRGNVAAPSRGRDPGGTAAGPARVVIKRGATFFLNGALIRAQDGFGAEIHLAEALLLPSQILAADEVRTPLQRLYYCVQQALIEPGRAAAWSGAFAQGLRDADASAPREILARIADLVAQERLAEALASLRRLIRAEAAA
ncbi:hypothetical protein VQ02_00810 [Methylobacterium variabile]|jgi:flagellar protein FlbT|uniref:Flagellar biosynthesis repressor FlbT n=1 Tax=Methylobacterium variabile TaxID=298794 RepID=A0A0J6TBC5_9HYPH|nr:flagellar biosynthesis repressor FlbT [Methylobacterium variabile]KMO43167.1 hypothetical protein VQ02_00810 [Methylobacterium variabile]